MTVSIVRFTTETTRVEVTMSVKLMVGGGGVINWSLMQNKLVDEVSVILAPIANGDPSAARFFTAREPYTTVEDMAFDLAHLEHLGEGVVWLRYTPNS